MRTNTCIYTYVSSYPVNTTWEISFSISAFIKTARGDLLLSLRTTSQIWLQCLIVIILLTLLSYVKMSTHSVFIRVLEPIKNNNLLFLGPRRAFKKYSGPYIGLLHNCFRTSYMKNSLFLQHQVYDSQLMSNPGFSL